MPIHISLKTWWHHLALGKFFKSAKDFVDKTAVGITQTIKTSLDSDIAKNVSEFIDEALHTHFAEDALTALKAATLQALAIELSIQGLPDNPTEADITTFEQNVYKAITGKDVYGTSKLWTELSVKLYTLINEALQDDKQLSFAEAVTIVEKAYQEYKQLITEQPQP